MRRRAILLLSLGLNLGLVVAFFVFRSRSAFRPDDASTRLAGPVVTNLVRTNVVVRRQFFSWREVESPDYPTYIANLRDIGCPESTIRDIIVADVNQLYFLKRATEVVTAEQQWWRSELDPQVFKEAEQKLQALDSERRALLTRLLGSNWEVTEPDLTALRSRRAIALDGPVLGVLPADAKQAVREIATHQQQKVQDYISAERGAGREPDPTTLARIRLETREELARVLSPTQLEEFLLRYSENADNVRTALGQLKYFNATPDEFRSLFRVVNQFDQQIEINYAGIDPATSQQRAELERQREEALKTALGDKRYEEYRRLQDPVYRDAMAAALQAGKPDSAQALYEISQATVQERNGVQADGNLTAQQKDIELKRIELEQAKANALAVGQKLPPEPPLPPEVDTRMTHVIESGETIDKLAARYGISIRDILSANETRDITKLKPGDPIYVPTGQGAKRP